MVIFSLDREDVYHYRKVYTELDLLGDVGGFLNAARIIGYFLTYVHGVFEYETILISKIFKKISEEKNGLRSSM